MTTEFLRTFYLLAALTITLALVGLCVAAPWCSTHSHPGWGTALAAGFAPLCHQRAERCFSVWGFPMPLCGRCLGLLLGVALGAVVGFVVHRPWRWYDLALGIGGWALLGVDVAMGGLGLYSGSNLWRLATGAAATFCSLLLIGKMIRCPSLD